MFDTPENRRKISKWIIGVFTCCILIYLGFRHIGGIAGWISRFFSMIKPLVLGAMLALVLNVPMSFLERNLRRKTKLRKGLRGLSIALALVLVFGILVGVAMLVVPEVVSAIRLVIQIISSFLDQLAQLSTDEALLQGPLGEFLSRIEIDWLGIKSQLEGWVLSKSGTFVNQAVGAAGSVAGGFVTFFISLVFAIYILAGKETLKRQVGRLIRVWLPQKFGSTLLHVSAVCGRTFRLFIAGQAMEAVILGTLCMVGMAILQIPYAPMIGALVGVTALIPVVGAFVGVIVGAIMILTVNPIKAVVFVVFLLVLQQIEGNMIYPKVVGSKINLPAIWVLAAVTVGGNIGGPLGMLLGVPIASAAYALLKEATCNRESKQDA